MIMRLVLIGHPPQFGLRTIATLSGNSLIQVLCVVGGFRRWLGESEVLQWATNMGCF